LHLPGGDDAKARRSLDGWLAALNDAVMAVLFLVVG
jgi:hypothetical protein